MSTRARYQAADFDGIVDGVKVTPRMRVDYRLRTLCGIVRDRLPGFKTPQVTYFRNSATAGWAIYRDHEIQLNSAILEANVEAFVYETVAHELAHLVRYAMHMRKMITRRELRQAHGAGWRHIMRAWFKVEPTRCHNYALGKQKVRRQRRWIYRCACPGDINMTTIKHNRHQAGTSRYRCVKCKTRVEFTGEQA